MHAAMARIRRVTVFCLQAIVVAVVMAAILIGCQMIEWR